MKQDPDRHVYLEARANQDSDPSLRISLYCQLSLFHTQKHKLLTFFLCIFIDSKYKKIGDLGFLKRMISELGLGLLYGPDLGSDLGESAARNWEIPVDRRSEMREN